MKAFVVAALIVVFVAVAFSDEEKRFFGSCDSNKECGQGECCVKYYIFSKCKKFLKKGAPCYKGFGKRGFGFKRCECDEGLICKGYLPFVGRCSSEGEEGSGDM